MKRKAGYTIVSVLLFLILLTGTAIAYPVTAADLAGIWKSKIKTPYGPAFVEVILKRNGKFSKTVKWRGLMTYDTGTYKVGKGFIHFTIKDHEPKYYKGVRQHWVKSETIFFRMVNRNKLICEDRIFKTKWVAYRVL